MSEHRVVKTDGCNHFCLYLAPNFFNSHPCLIRDLSRTLQQHETQEGIPAEFVMGLPVVTTLRLADGIHRYCLANNAEVLLDIIWKLQLLTSLVETSVTNLFKLL